MGRDKAFLLVGGRTLLTRALEAASAVTASVWIVGDTERFAVFGPVVEDVYPECGPLAGIHAALASTHADLNLIVAVDMPFLQPSFLHYLIAQARKSTDVVVVPKAGGGLQPLCAVYRRGFAEVAERALRAGRNKIDLLFDEVRTRVVEPEELERNGFSQEMFHNLNTRHDWEAARMRLPAEST